MESIVKLNYENKYLTYKSKYINLKKNINFYPIDLVLENLGSYYQIIKKKYELDAVGGQNYSPSTDSSVPRTSREKKFYKKYKNLIKSSAQSINYYKNLVQLQMSNQMKINNYYQNLVGILKTQRDRLAGNYQILGNDFKNEKEKISMLETMITGLEKYVQSSKDLDINVKKITLKGGAMGYDAFQDAILRDMGELTAHIDGIDQDKNFLEGKITELHKRMNDIVTQNDQLFKLKAEIEWIVNQMENVDAGESKAGQQEFDELYGKITGMIKAAKEKGTISKSIADYIHKLEEYAAYLENFIKSNDKTLGSIKLEKQAPKNDTVKEKQSDATKIGDFVTDIMSKPDDVANTAPVEVEIKPVSVTNTNTGANTGAPSNADEEDEEEESEPTVPTNTTIKQGQKPTSPKPPTNTTTNTTTIKQEQNPTSPKGKRKLVDDQLGGGNFVKLLKGGSFIADYNSRSDLMISKLKKVIENSFSNIDIQGKEYIILVLDNEIKSHQNQSVLTNKDFAIFFGKMATVSGLLVKLDKILDDYNGLYSYLTTNNPSLLKHDETSSNDIVELWKDVFKAKNTDFYADVLLKYQIYFYNYPDQKDQTIKFEDALKNLVKTDESSKITVKIQDENSLKTDIDLILKTLDNTVIVIEHLVFFIENMALTFIQGTKDTNPGQTGQKTIMIQQLEEIIKNKRDNLPKSVLVDTASVYSILYGQSGGAAKLALPDEPLEQINQADREIFLELFRLYSSSILVPSNVGPMTLTNQKQVDRTIELTYKMMSLYDKINLKLGNTGDKTMFAALTQEQKSIGKFSDFEKIIDKLNAETEPVQVTQTQDGTTKVSQVTKPRLDIYKNRLISCRDQLQPYMKNIAILRNLLFETKSGNFSIDETKVLLGLYNKVRRQIEDGINSYIKLIPMIFFTIEFPPSVYASQPCKYKFTFNNKKEVVEYKFIEGQNRTDCNQLGLGDFPEGEFVPNEFSSHAGFFESNKSNGTKKLIDDPVIGLGKLISSDSDPENPTNTTINMMFALGASGTGKTTRYFGKSNGHPDDKEGIVPYIINKSIEDGKSSDPNASPTKKISIAYFVCYGQKTQINNTDAGFNELVIFFDINSIVKSNSGDTSVLEDSKYIPFTMVPTANTNQKINKYTNFYSTVVSKKLDRRNYSELKGFITHGTQYPNLTPNPEAQQKTFRELIETVPEIWKTINPDESSGIGELFENLIIEQKKINTVLPTKNNIESSRGHTCVLVKIEDLATTNKVKYFPLFDMAGTENTGQIDTFLKAGRKTANMAKLVQKVNTVTQKADITRDDDETKQYPSLNDLLKYDNISKWVNNSKYLTIESVGGGKEKIRVNNFYADQLATDTSAGPGENFLNKVVKEGYYINHTISMLIFAAMCVGCSLRTELNVSDSTREDKFDEFFDTLFLEIDKFTCIPSTSGDADCVGKTMMLLAKKDSSSIVNSSCIWLQVLFSFLYWNEETPESISKWLGKINPNTTDALTYLCEPEVQASEIKTNTESSKNVPVMTVKELFAVGKVSNVTGGLDKLHQLMTNINKTHKFTSPGQQVLANQVSTVIADNSNLKIQYQVKGGAKTFVPTEVKLELNNPEYDSASANAYATAKRIRETLGKNPKVEYLVPTKPLTTLTKGKAQTEWTQYNNLPNEDKKAYDKVQTVTEYNEPEKVIATGKIYWDFFENETRVKKLEEFSSLLNGFLSSTNSADFRNKKSQKETEKKQVEETNNKGKPIKVTRDVSNPNYDKNFMNKLTEVVNSFTQLKLFGKTNEPDNITLAESFGYSPASKAFGSTENKIGKPLNLSTVTFENLKQIQTVITNIKLMHSKKETAEAAEKSSFTKIDKLKETLDDSTKIPQAELASIKTLLKVTGGHLELASLENKFNFVRNGVSIPINQVMEIINQFPQTLPVCPSDANALNKVIIENQMHRVRDGRAAATKMTLMHLVTGQGIKHFMVGETIKLCKTLYESTNLDLSA